MNLLKYSELLEKHPLTLATTDTNYQSNLAIAADVKVISDSQLLIAHNEMTKSIANLKEHPLICITCFNPDWVGVKIHGEAAYFTSGEYFDQVQELFANEKTRPQGAILITVAQLQDIS